MITVDWNFGAKFPLYLNASANTRLVGRETCLLIKLIRKVFYRDTWSPDFTALATVWEVDKVVVKNCFYNII